jgi:hypothetical protein
MDFQSIALPTELSALIALNSSKIRRFAAYYRLILNLQPSLPTGRIRAHLDTSGRIWTGSGDKLGAREFPPVPMAIIDTL